MGLLGEISVRMAVPACWQAEPKIHQTDQVAKKSNRSNNCFISILGLQNSIVIIYR